MSFRTAAIFHRLQVDLRRLGRSHICPCSSSHAPLRTRGEVIIGLMSLRIFAHSCAIKQFYDIAEMRLIAKVIGSLK